MFAADDILQENPTESLAISYKDDATATFRKRYRLYVTSYFARKPKEDGGGGFTVEQIQSNINILEIMAKRYLSIDGSDLELKHNKAHFYCGTASARTGGRGGVLQKVLFSEEAHYPDTEKMAAREIVDGTLRQVDINSGWAFRESTANGYGNYFELSESLANKGESRFKSRFYGWEAHYTSSEFEIIASEFTDKTILMQEYPRTREEAYISSGSAYFDNIKIIEYIKKAPEPKYCGSVSIVDGFPEFSEHNDGKLKVWETPLEYKSYVIGGDVAQGLESGDNSTLEVIDNQSMKCVAKYCGKIPPDEFALVSFALGKWYNNAYLGIEVNGDGLWVNTELLKKSYPNLYFREALDDITNRVGRKIGFRTTTDSRVYILAELQRMLYNNLEIWTNKDFLEECLTFVRNKVGKPEAMSSKHDDEIMATAIAYEIRRNAPKEFYRPEIQDQATLNIQRRLEKLYGNKNKNTISQQNYL